LTKPEKSIFVPLY